MNFKIFTLSLFFMLAAVCHGQDFTIETSNVEEGFKISMQIVNNPAADVTVNWGNGQSDTQTVAGMEKVFTAPIGLVGQPATITIDGAGKVEVVSLDNKIDGFTVNAANDRLWSLLINEGGLTTLDITNAAALTRFVAPLNNLTSVDLSGNPLLAELRLNGNADLETITVPDNLPELTTLSLNNTKANTMSVQNILSVAPNLEIVYINKKAGENDNKLMSVNLGNNTKIKDLQLQNNNISGVIDLTSCVSLEQALLNNNIINSVYVNSEALIYVNLNNNKISLLDLSAAPNLKNLYADDNELETLNLTANNQLINVLLNNNKLTSITFSPEISTLNSLELRNNRFTFASLPQVPVAAAKYVYSGQDDFFISVKPGALFSIDMSAYMNPFPVGSVVPGTAGQKSDVIWYGTFQGQELQLESSYGDYSYDEATQTYTFIDLVASDPRFTDNFVYAKITNPAFNIGQFRTIKVELGKSPVGIDTENGTSSKCYYSAAGNEIVYDVKDAQSIRIINLSGQVVYNRALNSDSGRIDAGNLQKGVYVIQLQTAGTVVKQKFIRK